MRKLILISVAFVILVLGFYLAQHYLVQKPFAIKINNFTMTKQEFDNYFNKMNVSGNDTPAERKKILDILISKKLILQEAEREGLDKSREFLNSLQDYYEQLLFKLIADKKSKELGSKVAVSDNEIKQYYEQLEKKNLITKPLKEVYNQLKWQIFRRKQKQVLDKWLAGLRRKADIEINEKSILSK